MIDAVIDLATAFRLLDKFGQPGKALYVMLQDPSRTWTPKDMALQLAMSGLAPRTRPNLGLAAYYMRTLHDRGCLELVKVDHVRGAARHHYALATVNLESK